MFQKLKRGVGEKHLPSPIKVQHIYKTGSHIFIRFLFNYAVVNFQDFAKNKFPKKMNSSNSRRNKKNSRSLQRQNKFRECFSDENSHFYQIYDIQTASFLPEIFLQGKAQNLPGVPKKL